MLLGLVGPQKDKIKMKNLINNIMEVPSFYNYYSLDIKEIELKLRDNLFLLLILYSPLNYKDYGLIENNKEILLLDGWLFDSSSYKVDEILQTSGNYRLVYINKNNKLIRIAVDRFTSRPIYYLLDKDKLIFGSNLKFLLPFSKENRISEEAKAQLLCFGHLMGATTLVNDIRFLPAGSEIVLNYSNNYIKTDIKFYYFPLQSEEIKDDYKTAKRKIKNLIFESAERTFKKREGLHLFSISGGLDSRLVLFLANKFLNKDQIYTYTFGYRESLDVELAFRVKDFFGVNHIFYDFPFEGIENYVERALEYNDGMVIWSGLIAGIGLFKDFLNSSNFSFVHTGQSGDFIFGSFIDDNLINIPFEPQKLWKILINKFLGSYCWFEKFKSIFEDYINLSEKIYYKWLQLFQPILDENVSMGKILNIWNLTNRQERAIFNGYRVKEHYLPFSSIFYDFKLFDYVFNLSYRFLQKEKIYMDVLKEIFPRPLLSIPWEKTGFGLNTNRLISYYMHLKNKYIPALIRRIDKNYANYSMTPFSVWLNRNKLALMSYIAENINSLNLISMRKLDKLLKSSCAHIDIVFIRLHHICKLKEKFKTWRRVLV